MKQVIIATALALTATMSMGQVAEQHDKAVGYCSAYFQFKGDYRSLRTLGRSVDGRIAIKYESEWKRLLYKDEIKALYEGRSSCLRFEKDVP